MCRELGELRQSVTEYAKGFDAHALIPSQAAEVVAICSRIEASVAAIRAMAAAVAAEGQTWKQEGYRSAAEQMADRTGTGTGGMRRAMDTGRRLLSQPVVAQAALAGDLSAEQAALVAQGAEADPSAADGLVERARTLSLGELREEVARVRAAATDLEARRQRIHAGRRLRWSQDLDGASHTHAAGHPEDAATLHRVVVAIRRRLNLISREQGRCETIEALDYDALMTLARVCLGEDAVLDLTELVSLGLFPQLQAGHLPGLSDDVAPGGSSPSAESRRKKKVAGSPPRVIVRVDLDALLRGVPLEGELCEIVGYGQIPVSVVEDLLSQGNTFLYGLLTKGEEVLSVYHSRRRPNSHQSTALDFLYPSCAARGCNSRAALQSDHRVDWQRTRFTVLDLMDRLCPHHHRLKTEKNWALVDGRGKREFVPPDHPLYPGLRC